MLEYIGYPSGTGMVVDPRGPLRRASVVESIFCLFGFGPFSATVTFGENLNSATVTKSPHLQFVYKFHFPFFRYILFHSEFY